MAEVTMTDVERTAQEVFGFGLRDAQKRVIERLVEGDSVCCVLPTGGGKSLTYQLPGLLFPHLTLVVSPLIALMKDQVDVLRSKGLPAAALDSSIGVEESRLIKQGIRDGSLKILYVAPERLDNESFVKSLAEVNISLLAIDEAHCVSTWGHSFRPTYLKVARFAKESGAERILCLTATATPKVAEDICGMFNIDLKQGGLVTTPTYRKNLHIDLRSCADLRSKYEALIPRLKEKAGPAIVYCTTQQQTEDVCKEVKKQGVEGVEFYHAGMNADERKRVQDYFMDPSVESPTIVATIAFGMGIDKSNIRSVIHFCFPKSVESYIQEIGRAGRDGKDSSCMLLMCAEDLPILEGFARGDTPSLPSVEDWLEDVCNAPKEENGSDIYVSNYQQERQFDIRSTTLGLLYAQLELTHEHLRALTAFYQVFELRPRTHADVKILQSERSPEAEALQLQWKQGRTLDKTGPQVKFTADVLEASAASGLPRVSLAMQITKWEAAGNIISKPSQTRNRYAIVKPLPEIKKERKALAQQLYDYMLKKEVSEVQRLKDLEHILRKPMCTSMALSEYFGDAVTPDLPQQGKCMHCTFCLTSQITQFGGSKSAQPVDEKKIEKILALIQIRDDARVLTRFAYGVTSPRLMQLKLSRHPLSGSMNLCNYEDLLQRFETACEDAGYQNLSTPVAAPVEKKRAAPGGARGGKAKKTKT